MENIQIQKLQKKIDKVEEKLNQLKARNQVALNREKIRNEKKSDRRKFILADLLINKPKLFKINIMFIYDKYIYDISNFKIEQFTLNFINCTDNEGISNSFTRIRNNLKKINLYILGYILERNMFDNPNDYDSVINHLNENLDEHWNRKLFLLPLKNKLLNDSGEGEDDFKHYFDNIKMPTHINKGLGKSECYWSIIYAIIYFDKENNCFGVVGQSKKDLFSLMKFFNSKIINQKLSYNKIDMTIKNAIDIGAKQLFFIPLEAVYSDLDAKGYVKDYWRKALNNAGIIFEISGSSYLLDNKQNRFFYYGERQIKYFPNIILKLA